MRAFLDASEITVRCQELERTRGLNDIWSAQVRLASQYATLTEGVTELNITANDGTTVLHSGRAWYGEDAGDANNQMTSIVSYDPRIMWDRFQVMDSDGDYSDPSIFEDFESADQIMVAAIDNWIANESAIDLTVNDIPTPGVPLVGYKPVDWPLSLLDLWNLLVDTGELDVMLNPATGGASTVDIFNGDAGTDLSGSVSLDYNTGAFNCMEAKYTFDMQPTITRIRYFLGPKRPWYVGDIQHWAGDVQKDDPDLPNPPQADIDARIAALEAVLPIMREIRVYDSNGDENDLRDLYFRLWQSEMIVRTTPRRLLQVTPEPGTPLNFNVADIISVNANIRGTVGGAQRVYGYTVSQDTEGNEILTSVTTSADQEI